MEAGGAVLHVELQCLSKQDSLNLLKSCLSQISACRRRMPQSGYLRFVLSHRGLVSSKITGIIKFQKPEGTVGLAEISTTTKMTSDWFWLGIKKSDICSITAKIIDLSAVRKLINNFFDN